MANIFTMYIQAYVDLMFGDYEIDVEETEELMRLIKIEVGDMTPDQILSSVVDCVENALSVRDDEKHESFLN